MTIATRAARAAGNIILRHSDELDQITVEAKAHNDFVSQVDRLAEEQIIQIIHASYPNHAIMAEESGAHGKGDYLWIIDPLDGTTNFLHGYLQYAVSIACMVKGKLEIAVVYNPATEELFSAERGRGALLNNKRIRVSKQKTLAGALISTGIPFSANRDFDAFWQVLRQFMSTTAGVRRSGSAALDLAYVAAGRTDGYWEGMLKIWDIAAGVLLVEEAGGLVCDFAQQKDYMQSGNIIAAPARMQAEMLKILRDYQPQLTSDSDTKTAR